jgi:hypothetical protein
MSLQPYRRDPVAAPDVDVCLELEGLTNLLDHARAGNAAPVIQVIDANRLRRAALLSGFQATHRGVATFDFSTHRPNGARLGGEIVFGDCLVGVFDHIECLASLALLRRLLRAAYAYGIYCVLATGDKRYARTTAALLPRGTHFLAVEDVQPHPSRFALMR